MQTKERVRAHSYQKPNQSYLRAIWTIWRGALLVKRFLPLYWELLWLLRPLAVCCIGPVFAVVVLIKNVLGDGGDGWVERQC